MEKVRVLTRGRVLFYSSEKFYIKFSNGRLFQVINGKSEKSIIVEKNILYRLFSSVRLLQRALRLEPRVSLILPSKEMLFTYRGSIYRYDAINNQCILEHKLREGMNNPLYFTEYYDINGDHCILYGEYFPNIKNQEVKIFKRVNGLWSNVYTFEKNSILHVHNIIYEKDKKEFFIFSGDSDEESAIWKSDIYFKNVTKIVAGNQIYRSCFGYIYDGDLYYFSDTPLENNFFIHLNTNNFDVKKIQLIEGPVIYGIFKNETGIISTSVEPDSNVKGIKYLLTHKLGKGVLGNMVNLYSIKNNRLMKIITIPKDVYPGGLFQFGNLYPILLNDQSILVYCMAVKKYDGKTIIIEMR